jgi:hypothetical protein
MKITFKVMRRRIARIGFGADSAQDLKQNKFVIEAEPSETVRRAATPLPCIAGF